MPSPREEFRERLKNLCDEYRSALQGAALVPGRDYLPPSGKIVGAPELEGILDAAADLHLTAGRFCDELESALALRWGAKKALLVNSGSSANLLAVATLASHALGEEALKSGDEVITAAVGFPTTVAPAVQHGLVPVFVDVALDTLNVTAETIEAALSPRTRLVMLAHTLGNPFRADLVRKVCDKRGIPLVEDCCDAFGATIEGKPVGAFGAFSTCSFYPAHQMTTGEGGAVLTNDAALYRIAMSIRDWGRDCWCAPGVSNTCGRRFGWKLGDLPEGYDHKYVYAHAGYNLKMTDLHAAIGLAQLRRFEGFLKARRDNHAYLGKLLREIGVERDCILPVATPGTEPSWFGYALTLQTPGLRGEVVRELEANKVGTRMLFGGNLARQPAFRKVAHRTSGSLGTSDRIMNDTFWVGVWPGLGKAHLDYIADKIKDAITHAKEKLARPTRASA